MNYLNELKKLEILHVDNNQYIEIIEINKDDYLLHQGEKLNHIYILLKGKVKVNHINANGNSMLCGFNSPYSIIGELEFITHSSIINNVIAYEDCICATISLSKYHEILINDVFFMKTIAKNLASKLSKSNQNQSILLNYPVENRLAAYFIVSHKDYIVQDNFVVVAELIGCSYRQLQRVLKLFLDKKYIKKIKRGTYQIVNLNALNLLGEDVYQF